MKTKLILFVMFLLAVFNTTYGQKNITVDFSTTIDTVKDLLGGNLLFDNTASLLHNEGLKIIRSHDFHHSLDYSDYSAFWNSNGSGNYTLNMSFDPENPADYFWYKADSVISFIKNNSFDIFFRIGVSYPNPNTPPLPPYDPPCNSSADNLNFSRFASLCKHIIKHYNNGWDNGQNDSITYWEVWNEPGGLFWNGSVLQFYKMYQAVSDSIKNYAPNCKIGAPGAVPSTSIGVHTAYREGFINFCSQNNLPLDFYSWHLYGYKNPYGIKEIADTIRAILDDNGYTNAENIISEINSSLDSTLDTLAISPYGAAYYLSTILTAQKSCIDKLFWYPSCVGIRDMATGDTIHSRVYYGMTCFHNLQETTPVEVPNDGDIVVDGNWDNYETNFMVLSSKSEDNQKFSVLISNLSSNVDSVVLNLHGLPFTTNDTVKITKQIISSNYIFNTEETVVTGDSVITINNFNCPNPGVLFYQLEKRTTTSTNEMVANTNIDIYPNPASQNVNIIYSCNKKESCNISIYNMTGKKIKTIFSGNLQQGKHKFVWNVPGENNKIRRGSYICTIQTENGCITKKIIIN